MRDEEKKVEIKKPEQNGVVPAIPQKDLRPPQALKVHNPLLVTQPGALPTTCAQCGARVHRAPASVPFKGGPYQGGFLCRECWILEWAGNPDVAADAPTRQWFAEEARRIKMRRAGGASTLYQDGVNNVYLTQRGTVLIDLARLPFGSADEYDPARYQALMRLFKAVTEKMPEFRAEPRAPKKQDPPADPPKA